MQFLDVAVFIVAGVLFYVVVTSLSRMLAPRLNPAQATPYECGVAPFGEAQVPFHPNYYLYALLFVVFDVEVVFVFPWAVAARELGRTAFGEMLVFVGILLVGLIYALRKRVLRWL